MNMKRIPVLLTLATVMAALGLPAAVHHSFQAEYDQTKPMTLVGKITRVINENPHGWIYLEVKNPNGKTVIWQLETPGPGVLNQNGFNRSVFEALMMTEEVVTVTAYAARDESKHAWAGGLTRADGRTVITLSGIPGR